MAKTACHWHKFVKSRLRRINLGFQAEYNLSGNPGKFCAAGCPGYLTTVSGLPNNYHFSHVLTWNGYNWLIFHHSFSKGHNFCDFMYGQLYTRPFRKELYFKWQIFA